MRLFPAEWTYRLRLYIASRWCDPALLEMARRHGAVLVTPYRSGIRLLPIYHALSLSFGDGDLVGYLSGRIRALERRVARYER